MIFRKILILQLLALHFISCLAQQLFSFPIDTVDITGNFGEIRNQHFHQGIDFSTKGKENFPVKSIDDGYVYRIKISSKGYGKALYIHHPSGLLSVYAHLNSFSDKIQKFLNQHLIQNHQNETDIILKKDSIPIKKNEVIAYSGNTGTSSGPHLHFEIRNELTEIPINPLFYFAFKDTTKPSVQKIIFFNLSDTISPVPIVHQQTKGKKQSDTIIVPPITGIAFSGNDKMYPNGNPNNIYKVQIFLDNQKIYQHRLHYITFDNTIYVEYYAEKIRQQYFQKCFAPHLYPKYFYDTLINKGRIILSDTNIHTLRLSFCDEFNNCKDTILYIQTKSSPVYKKINTKQLLLCNTSTHIKNQYFELYIPEKSLFHDIKANIFYNPDKKQIEFSHKPLSLKFSATLKIFHHLPASDIQKTVLTGSRYYLPDTSDQHQIIFSVKELANFRLYTDKEPPHIKPLSYNLKKKAIIIPYSQNKIYFKLSDNTSLKDFKVYFNSQFCIAYYYASKKTLEVQLPQEYIAADQNQIQIIASDIVDNTITRTYSLIFK
ncbi:MAG: M23 family metallopeptidase [Bacteroidia bacterium]